MPYAVNNEIEELLLSSLSAVVTGRLRQRKKPQVEETHLRGASYSRRRRQCALDTRCLSDACLALTAMSDVTCDTYLHSMNNASDDGWRRGERGVFEDVVELIERPAGPSS